MIVGIILDDSSSTYGFVRLNPAPVLPQSCFFLS